MSFDNQWENQIYKKGKQINSYPFDEVVSDVNRMFRDLNVSNFKALDLGCGTGNNSKFLLDYGFGNVIGIDGSKSAIKIARDKYKSKKCKFLIKNFNNFKIKKNYFNLVLDRGSITHNKLSNIKKIYNKIFLSMKSNGIFISHIFNKKHSKIKKNSFKETMLLKKKITASFFDKKEILKLLENFQIVSKKEFLKKDLKSKFFESFWLIVAKK